MNSEIPIEDKLTKIIGAFEGRTLPQHLQDNLGRVLALDADAIKAEIESINNVRELGKPTRKLRGYHSAASLCGSLCGSVCGSLCGLAGITDASLLVEVWVAEQLNPTAETHRFTTAADARVGLYQSGAPPAK